MYHNISKIMLKKEQNPSVKSQVKVVKCNLQKIPYAAEKIPQK